MKKKLLIITQLLFITFLIFSSEPGGGIGARFADSLRSMGINPYLVVLIIATLPIVELRGAIPVGILFLELEWVPVIAMAIIGNMLPIFFILFVFKYMEKLVRMIPIFDRFLNWFFARTMAKSSIVEKYEEFGLMLFVAVPLPVTGAWTGSAIAYLMKLSYKKSLLFIFLGVLIASAVVTIITFLTHSGANAISG